MSTADDLANIRADAYAHVSALDASINESDKVYRNAATGKLVKVRAERIAPPPPPAANKLGGAGAGFGLVIVQISGSMCGEDGRALVFGEGHQIAPAQRHTFQSDQPADFAISLERLRLEVACATERAAYVEAQLAGASGGGLPR